MQGMFGVSMTSPCVHQGALFMSMCQLNMIILHSVDGMAMNRAYGGDDIIILCIQRWSKRIVRLACFVTKFDLLSVIFFL